MSDKAFGITTINGHGILRCEVGVFKTHPDDADVQGIDPYTLENTEWQPHTFDLTLNPPVEWNPHYNVPEFAGVTWENGDSSMLRMTFEEFDALYTDWLAKQQRWPELN